MSQAIRATISSIAESLGFTHLKESVTLSLADIAQKEIIHIISNSCQFRMINKRMRLRVNDINDSLESKGMQPLFGYSCEAQTKLINAGVVSALEILFYDDERVRVDGIPRYEPAEYPWDVSYDVQWLAIDGTSLSDEDAAPVERVVSLESSQLQSSQLQSQQQLVQPVSDLEIASSKHLVSYELQLYYKQIREYLLGSDQEKKESRLYDLSVSPSLQSLLPYYLRFCLLLQKDNPHVYDKIYTSISVARALVGNTKLKYFDVYLPHFISLALSSLLSPTIGPADFVEYLTQREYSADLLRALVDYSFKKAYGTLQPRLTAQLVYILYSQSRSTAEKFGALNGIFNLGIETISKYILPELPLVLGNTEVEMRSVDMQKRDMSIMYYHLCLKSAGYCFHADSLQMFKYSKFLQGSGLFPINWATLNSYREVSSMLGSDLVPYFVDDSSLLFI